MNVQEQYMTAENALTQSMIHHAVTIMTSWAKDINALDAYSTKLHTLSENAEHIFDWYLAHEDGDREEQIINLTGRAFLLLDELYHKVVKKNNEIDLSVPPFSELMEMVDWEDPTQTVDGFAQLIYVLVAKDNRIDFFPEFQAQFEEAIGDGTVAFSMLLAILDSLQKVKQTNVPLTQILNISRDSFMENLPSSYLYDVLVGEDEERAERLAITYLKGGRMDLVWEDRLQQADAWLLKKLRSKRATAWDYLNYGHCCWILRDDRLMAYENYRSARVMLGSAKEFFAHFRPDRHYLAEKEIPLEQIYIMEDQLLHV